MAFAFQTVKIILVCFLFHFSVSASQNAENGNQVHSLLNKIRNNQAEDRIIGGHEAKPNSIPYMVFMVMNGTSPWGPLWGCGGSLITPNFILTAAHCGSGAEEVLVGFLGAHDIYNSSEPNQRLFTATDIRVHENYSLNTIQNDIAIVKLRSTVQLTQYINIIPLPKTRETGDFYFGKTARISGWGHTNGFSMQLSHVLNYVDVKVLTHEECQKFFAGFIKVPEFNICTSGQDLTGPCHGDSGSPLVIDGVQVGIVSFGYMYCAPGYPASFARVDQYLDWINKQIIT